MAMKERTCLPLTWRHNPAGLGLLLASAALLALGVVMVHSAVASVAEAGPLLQRRDVRHTIFAAAALLLLLVAWRFDYRRLVSERRLPILLLGLLAAALATAPLVYVPGIGQAAGGRHRWVRFAIAGFPLGFQPSELIRMAVVLFLAGWLTRPATNRRSLLKTFLPALILIAGSAAVVLRDDFGMAALIVLSGLVTLFLAGVPWYYLASVVLPAVGGFFLMSWFSAGRWARIMAMIDPWDPNNPCAYHARQSLLAIMTGGWFGKGLGQGMLKRGYLPEGHTDFIFSVFCEEWGLAGAVLLVGLVVLWICQARRAAVQGEDDFGRTLAGSMGVATAVQAVLHIAVDLVAAPPAGMAFPFVSAGGTQLIAAAAAAALIISVSAHRSLAEEAAPAPAIAPVAPAAARPARLAPPPEPGILAHPAAPARPPAPATV